MPGCLPALCDNMQGANHIISASPYVTMIVGEGQQLITIHWVMKYVHQGKKDLDDYL